MDMTLPTAESIFFWSNWVLVGALATGVVATYLIVVSGNVKEAFAKKEALEASKVVAAAGAAAGEANKKAAEATERAAVANRIAEVERLERLKLEEKLAPRFLSDAQRSAIKKALLPFKGNKLDIIAYPSAPDVQSFANELAETIGAAEWTVRVWVAIGSGRVVRGTPVQTLLASGNDVTNAATALVQTLVHERLGAALVQPFPDGELPDALSGPTWEAAHVAPIRMSVGSKP